MSTFYFDTSALIKRYLSETGSDWIQALCNPQTRNVLIISDLAVVEFASTLARRQREGAVSEANAAVLTERFLADFKRDYLSISLASPVILAAHNKARTSAYPLRALDAIQLACALEVRELVSEPMTFISADIRLLEVAASEGFLTDNPNDHP